jgi:5'-3' exonuclease
MTKFDERPILIIDAFNNFIRYAVAIDTTTEAGDFVGGVVGFLNFLENVTAKFAPSRVYVVWEKGGGSARRKSIYPEYKANRASVGLDKNLLHESTQNTTEDDQKPEGRTKLLRESLTEEDKIRQILLLTQCMRYLPVCQVYQPDSEGDDVMAYLAVHKLASISARKYIISNDHDFCQLITPDDSILVYNPQKKQVVNNATLKELYGISGRNFCLARSVAGDTSDNINGVDGIGLKTMAKRFPMLISDDQDMDVDTLLSECTLGAAAKKKAPKCFADIIDNEAIVRRNWDLMYLGGTQALSANQINKIDYVVDNHKPIFNKLSFLRELLSEKIQLQMNLDRFTMNMHGLIPILPR